MYSFEHKDTEDHSVKDTSIVVLLVWVKKLIWL